MEDFIEVFFVLIAIGASVVSSAMKAKKSKAAVAQHRASAPVAQKSPTASPKATHPYAPARMQQTVFPSMSVADAPGPVITPTVHTHIQPDCETHDAPGSLNFTSTEGKDPCHEDQLTHTRSYTESVQEEPAMTFDWSGENMVKAFVMQEVLTRPCQRRAR